jgi:hypothetical protein
MRLLHGASQRLTYANVMATLALFIALGGTSYAALTLPKNSVGSKQIRKGAVGGSELRTGAVSSRSIKNQTIRTSDLSLATRASLRGAQGPPGLAGPPGPSGVALRAIINSGGGRVAGNADRSTHAAGTNVYRIDFARDLTGCVFAATLAAVQNGASIEQPPAGRVTLEVSGREVVVKTYDISGSAAPVGFHLLGACS